MMKQTSQVGEVVPDFAFEVASEKSVRLSDWGGRPTLLVLVRHLA